MRFVCLTKQSVYLSIPYQRISFVFAYLLFIFMLFLGCSFILFCFFHFSFSSLCMLHHKFVYLFPTLLEYFLFSAHSNPSWWENQKKHTTIIKQLPSFITKKRVRNYFYFYTPFFPSIDNNNLKLPTQPNSIENWALKYIPQNKNAIFLKNDKSLFTLLIFIFNDKFLTLD